MITRLGSWIWPLWVLSVAMYGFIACSSHSDNNGDGGQEDGSVNDGGDQETPKICECKNPLDKLFQEIVEEICVRDNYICNALNLCDDGYLCDLDECTCADKEVCGIDCSNDCECTFPSVCDEGIDRCRLPMACLDDSMCSGGQVCRGERYLPYYICLEPYVDGKEVGQECSRRWECKSDTCYTDVCLQFCTKNADCPSGQFCALVDFVMTGCVLQTECGSDCNGPDEYCSQARQECRNENDFCRTGVDCEGDCLIEFFWPLIGLCSEESKNCEDDEFTIFQGVPPQEDEHCYIYKSCWSDQDCPDPYTCVPVDDYHQHLMGDSSFCARPI